MEANKSKHLDGGKDTIIRKCGYEFYKLYFFEFFINSPGYTLSTALLQIVTFFADPDYRTPIPESLIEELRTIVEQFRCSICGHSNKKPVPAVVSYIETVTEGQQKDTKTVSKEEEERLKSEFEKIKLQVELKEKLTCGVTKQNFFDDKICLGYPILIKRDNLGRLWSEIVLELISYDAYVAEIQVSGGVKLEFYENFKFRSVTGADYNHWLPLYINQKHFEQGKTIIQNSISIIYSGTAQGTSNNDFVPQMALNVLTSLMNKSAVRLFNGQMFESKQAIEAYCHFLRLLMHFIDLYPKLNDNINKTINNFLHSEAGSHKKAVPDIGEFLIKIALSNRYELNKIKKLVYEEYFARQILWIQQALPSLQFQAIKEADLPQIFQASKVSNHLLVFNLEMVATFIFPGVKE